MNTPLRESAANLPWASECVFGMRRLVAHAGMAVLGVLAGALLLLGHLFERNATGDAHAQDWEFYAVGFFLFWYSPSQRDQSYAPRNAGHRQIEIARTLKRDPFIIGREIRRNAAGL
ncbi:MAG: DUF2818 family protein [Candidatus Eutrophobiaceae bacterium]